jgi:hypothetical protein
MAAWRWRSRIDRLAPRIEEFPARQVFLAQQTAPDHFLEYLLDDLLRIRKFRPRKPASEYPFGRIRGLRVISEMATNRIAKSSSSIVAVIAH